MESPSTASSIYLAVYTDRSHPAARKAIRDAHCFGKWSAFYDLVRLMHCGGTLGIDDKLFLIPGEAELVCFEQGQRVNNFRDVRADARCILESGLMGFRMKMEDLLEYTGQQFVAIQLDVDPLESSGKEVYHSLVSELLPTTYCATSTKAAPASDYIVPYLTPPLSSHILLPPALSTALAAIHCGPPPETGASDMKDKLTILPLLNLDLPASDHETLMVGDRGHAKQAPGLGISEQEWQREIYNGMMVEYRRLRSSIRREAKSYDDDVYMMHFRTARKMGSNEPAEPL